MKNILNRLRLWQKIIIFWANILNHNNGFSQCLVFVCLLKNGIASPTHWLTRQCSLVREVSVNDPSHTNLLHTSDESTRGIRRCLQKNRKCLGNLKFFLRSYWAAQSKQRFLNGNTHTPSLHFGKNCPGTNLTGFFQEIWDFELWFQRQRMHSKWKREHLGKILKCLPLWEFDWNKFLIGFKKKMGWERVT